MSRYAAGIESQATQLAGVNAGLTVNGYMGYWGGSVTSGFRLRRLILGCRTTTAVPATSQQIGVGIYRQTVAPAGTGIVAAVLGQPMETHTPQTDPTAGIFAINATAIGTTAPTLAANPLFRHTFNSQNSWDVPVELLEELICAIGTANGLAFVNLYNTLPANHIVTVGVEIEV